MRKILLLLLIFAISCTSTQNYERIVISGSDTMYHIMEILSAVYMKKNPHISIYVSGGGTEYGIQSIENNIADICMASRNLNNDELKFIADKFKSIGVTHIIAKDAISIYVNQVNSIENISIEQLKKIYNCSFKSWADLNMNNDLIFPLRRASTSGTYHYFKGHILDGNDFCQDITIVKSQEEMINKIENNVFAIGFGGVGNHGNTKLLKIEGIDATQDNIKKDKYLLTRYLQLITISEPQGKVKNFIDWILSTEGQNIIRNFGYVSLY